MTQSSILKEFLISLGFRIDQSGFKNFNDGMGKATKTVLALGAAASAMATTVAYAAQRVGSNLEQLYFAAKRTGSSATDLEALDRTMQNFGASAGEGIQAVENLSRAFRTNPGNASMVEALIGPLKRLKDGSIDAEDALLRLSKPIHDMPESLAYQYGGMFDTPEHVLLALRSGDVSKEFGRVRGEVSGMNLGPLTEQAHRFMITVRDIRTGVQALGYEIIEALQKKYPNFTLVKIRDWLFAHGPEMATKIADVIGQMIDAIKSIIPYVEKAIHWFEDFDKSTGGLASKIGIALIALKAIGALDVITGIAQLGAAVVSLGAGLATLSVNPVALAGLAAIATWVAYKKSQTQEGQDGIGEWTARTLSTFGFRGASDALATNSPLQYLVDEGGFTVAQAAGILANLQAESSMNPAAENKGHYGLEQLDKEGQADFKNWAGHDIRGTGPSEQLDFLIYELQAGKYKDVGKMLAAQNDYAQSAYLYAMYREKPGKDEAAREAEAERRAGLAAAMAPQVNTTINVYGGTDNKAIADAVADKQKSTYAKAVRTFSVPAGAVP